MIDADRLPKSSPEESSPRESSPPRSLYRGLLIAAFVVGCLNAVADCFAAQLLPLELQAHAADVGPYPLLYLGAIVVAEAVLVTGLWFYRPWARFLLTTVAMLSLVGSLAAPTVQPGLNAALSLVEFGLLGALLVMVWSVLPARFVRR